MTNRDRSADLWALIDAGAHRIASKTLDIHISNRCKCGAPVDSFEASILYVTGEGWHVLAANEHVVVSLRDIVDFNPELFTSIDLPPSPHSSKGCSLCHDTTI